MRRIALIALAAAIAVILAGCDSRDAVDKALDNVDPDELAAFKRGLNSPVSVFNTTPPSAPEIDLQELEDAIARGVEKGIRNAAKG